MNNPIELTLYMKSGNTITVKVNFWKLTRDNGTGEIKELEITRDREVGEARLVMISINLNQIEAITETVLAEV